MTKLKDAMKKQYSVHLTKEYVIDVEAPTADLALQAAMEKDVIHWESVGLDVGVEAFEFEDDDEDE